MGIIEMDFQSIVIGYMVGVMLMWSLCNTLYGDNNNEKEKQDRAYSDIWRGVRNGDSSEYSCFNE